ncbi:uncharacterized protein LOC141706101 [Apium graveolens]|uniref:uncharacterized protein LOC141706101 n=1 Tax=Apium graveolens TaxID=4045 RepID=UPI003D7B15D1
MGHHFHSVVTNRWFILLASLLNICMSTFSDQCYDMCFTAFAPRRRTCPNFFTGGELAQNYIYGTIPISFGQLPLITRSLVDTCISGSIPRELANITLEELIFGDNQLGASLPPGLEV